MNDSTKNNEKSDSCTYAPVQFKLQVKLPEFIFKDPEIWLIQVESQFILWNITSEEAQYHHIVSRLPQSVIIHYRDIVKDGYKRGSLQLLKKALIDRNRKNWKMNIYSLFFVLM